MLLKEGQIGKLPGAALGHIPRCFLEDHCHFPVEGPRAASPHSCTRSSRAVHRVENKKSLLLNLAVFLPFDIEGVRAMAMRDWLLTSGDASKLEQFHQLGGCEDGETEAKAKGV
jgi:hypothetical protein